MKTIRTTPELREWLNVHPSPAFVPTMGALHRGHLSLVEHAKKSGRPVLVSIFVNPEQFGPHEDFDAYPRDIAGDLEKLEEIGADAVYLPEETDIYPPGVQSEVPALPKIFAELEGAERPGHFEGVAKVLSVFFEMIRPQEVFFGQKDYQQTVLVKWLVKALRLPITVRICPIIREESGLAMSSRNQYLSDERRQLASVLFKSLQEAKTLFGNGEDDPRVLEKKIREVLERSPAVDRIDYVEVRDAETLERQEKIDRLSVVLLVVRVGKTRLLDNMLLRKEFLEV